MACFGMLGPRLQRALQDTVSDDMVGLSGRLLANVRAMQGAVESREGLLNQAEAAQDVSATNAHYAVKTSKNIKNRCPTFLGSPAVLMSSCRFEYTQQTLSELLPQFLLACVPCRHEQWVTMCTCVSSVRCNAVCTAALHTANSSRTMSANVSSSPGLGLQVLTLSSCHRGAVGLCVKLAILVAVGCTVPAMYIFIRSTYFLGYKAR